jgi:hypothetical protein
MILRIEYDDWKLILDSSTELPQRNLILQSIREILSIRGTELKIIITINNTDEFILSYDINMNSFIENQIINH